MTHYNNIISKEVVVNELTNIQIAVPTLENIAKIQEFAAMLPQLPSLKTEHYFSGSLYCRQTYIAKNTLIVGKKHKSQHFFIMSSGHLRVWEETLGTRDFLPGMVTASPPGTKRILVALEDSICSTVHFTTTTNIEDLAAELVEEEAVSFYDAYNNLKESV